MRDTITRNNQEIADEPHIIVMTEAEFLALIEQAKQAPVEEVSDEQRHQ